MQQPSIQNSIRLLNFIVTSVKLEASSEMSPKYLGNLDIQLGFDLGFNKLDEKKYSVKFNILLSNEGKSFSLALEAIALFESREYITEEFKNSDFIKLNSPAIAFPFVRSFINTLTTNAGLTPIVLPPFNFAKTMMNQEGLKRKKKQIINH